MSNKQAIDRITQLRKRHLANRWTEIVLMAVAIFLLTWNLLALVNYSIIFKSMLSIAVALGIVIWKIIQFQLHHFNNQTLIRYLNTHYPQLEESADLILKDDDSLSNLQKLQLQKTLKHFDAFYPEIKIPHTLRQSIAISLLCIAVAFLLSSSVLPFKLPTGKNSINELAKINSTTEKGVTTITSFLVNVIPPSYTGAGSYKSTTPDLKVPEGSKVTWKILFSGSIKKVQLLLSGKDSVPLTSIESTYQASLIITNSGFYQIAWGENSQSDYFKIEVINDQPPKVIIDNLNQFTKLSFTNNIKVPVQSIITDDYGLTNATIVATVSKGSGESVKFREEKFSFEKPTVISGKTVKAFLTLNLTKMGMETGDELYFYVQAFDNKMPIPNHTRTETYFIALNDTTKQVIVEDDGLGVDLMPEYFRSQRQIIIDTEKLLREKKKIALHLFKSTSNELGYDQKVLRLRYGQFLGEEFEGQIGKASIAEEEKEEESHENTIEKFGHAHDKENEHNLVTDKKPITTGHSHEGELNETEGQENPLEAFAHNHDDGEQATFFVQSVRAKLKATLTVMWDAELYLRLYEPEKSLPYQYTALKLLKEISNDSRIYVHRTGFDPPPLKEEKRLTANLEEVRNSTAKTKQFSKENYPEIRKAIVLIEHLLDKEELTNSQKQQMHRAGQELVMIAINQPGEYLEALSLIKKVMEEKKSNASLLKIRTVFWKVLPEESQSPTKSKITTHTLDQQFLKNLNELNND